MIFNHWFSNSIPGEIEDCNTTLMAKTVNGLKDGNNWRPVTIGNSLMRLYAKCWDRQLREVIKIDETQKGFVPVDGCFTNSKILQEKIKQQRKRRKAYQMVFIDLAKAFNMVTHESIRKALYRKGVPLQVVTGELDM